MKVLITGGAGFIASTIADRYIALGHDVVIVDSLITGQKRNIPEQATFYQMDIGDPAIADVFAKEKPDVVNHHAAQIDVRKSVADPANDAVVNIIGGLNLLQCCVAHGVKKFIFASTGGAIYGEQDYFPADEQHPTRPLSPYGITKLTTEKYLHFYHHTHGLKYTVLRYANVYGPRQNPHGEAGVVAIFCKRMLSGDQPVINGDGKQTRDYVFVDDVVQANALALEGGDQMTYNVGTGVETDVNQLFHMLADAVDHDVEEKHGPGAAGEQQRSVLDAGLIQRELGWKPTVEIATGLHRTMAFFRSL